MAEGYIFAFASMSEYAGACEQFADLCQMSVPYLVGHSIDQLERNSVVNVPSVGSGCCNMSEKKEKLEKVNYLVQPPASAYEDVLSSHVALLTLIITMQ